MILDLVSGLVFAAVPLLLALAAKYWRWANAVGPVILAYAAGIALALSGVLPDSVEAVRVTVTEASLALALPLLMFAIDLGAWRRLAGPALKGMALAVLAVVLVAVLLFFATGGDAETRAQLSGLAIGMYTGGLANIGAVKLALATPDNLYLAFVGVDTVIGALYLLFMLTLAPPLFRRWLPKTPIAPALHPPEAEAADRRGLIADGVVALVAAGLIVGLSVAIAPLIPFGAAEVWIILLITSLGLLAGQIPLLRRNAAAEGLGMNLIYIFSFSVAAGLDLAGLAGVDPSIPVFVAAATFGAVAVHFLFCRLFRVDADSFMITSIAAIMSPAFVPMLVRSLGNPGMLMSGVVAGLIGFALGNYLAISVALLLGAFGG